MVWLASCALPRGERQICWIHRLGKLFDSGGAIEKSWGSKRVARQGKRPERIQDWQGIVLC